MIRFIYLVPLFLGYYNLHASDGSLPAKTQQKIRALLQSNQDEYGMVGQTVAVLKNGKQVYTEAIGFADKDLALPASRETIFQIFSCSKLFTHQRLGRLVDAKKLTWDAPISQYLDGLPESWQQVTVRQLVNHVSGLPEYYRDFDHPMPKTAEAALARVREEPFEFPTQSSVKYNQTNYLLLKMIIEKLTGETYAQGLATFLQQNGLNHTRHGDITADIPGRASTYQPGKDGLERVTTLDQPHYMITATGLNSNVVDLADWFSRLLAGEFVSKATLNAMWQPTKLNDGTLCRFAGGFERSESTTFISVGHGGGGRCDVRHFMPKNGTDTISIIYLSNGGARNRNPRDMSQRIANIVSDGTLMPLLTLSDTMSEAIAKGNWPAARAAYTAFKKADPTHPSTEDMLNNLGYAVWGKFDAAKALPVFQLNVEEHPAAANPYDSLGEAQLELGDTVNARKNYEKAQALAPNDRVANILKQLNSQ